MTPKKRLPEPPVAQGFQAAEALGVTPLRQFPGRPMLAHSKAKVVVWSPDGGRLASAGGGQGGLAYGTDAVQVWDRHTGAALTKFGYPKFEPSTLAWTGSWLVGVEVAAEAVVWDAERGAVLGTFRADTSIYELVCAQTNRRCVTADSDGKIVLWDLEGLGTPSGVATREDLWTAADSVFALALTDDGKTVYVPNHDSGKSSLHVFDTATKTRQRSFPLEGEVRSLALYPDGKRIAVGCITPSGEAIVVHSMPDGQVLTRMFGHTHHIYGLSVLADGRLLSASGDGTVRVWSEAGQQLHTLDYDGSALWSLQVSPDGKEFAVAGNSRVIPVWTTDTLARKFDTTQSHEERVSAIAFSPDGQELMSVDTGGKLLVRNATTGAVRVLHTQSDSFINLQIHPNGKEFLTLDSEQVRHWDLETGKPRQGFASDRFANYWFHPNGRQLLRGDPSRVVAEIDAYTGSVARTFGTPEPHDEMRQNLLRASSITISSDGKWMAMARWDQPVHVYELATGVRVQELMGTLEAVFRPDGSHLAVGAGTVSKRGNDLSIRIYETATWQQKSTLAAEPTGMQYSPNGELLAVFEHGAVALWEPLAGKKVALLKAPGHQVASFAFAPNGKKIATGGHDGSVLTWELDAVSGPRANAGTNAK